MPAKRTLVFLGSDILGLSLEVLLARPEVSVRAVFAGEHAGYARVRRLASAASATLVLEPFDPVRHAALLEGVDVLLTAGYTARIPPTRVPYSVNLHPTLLPVGRGPRPIEWILFDYPHAGGVTLHVHAPDFDAGPVVARRALAGTANLSFEAYVMLCNQLGAELVSAFVDDPETQFSAAEPQDLTNAPLLPTFPVSRRTISAAMRGADIVAAVRRLGPSGALLEANGMRLRVTGAEFVQALGTRPHKPFQNNAVYSALKCADGFVVFRPSDLQQL